MKLQNIIIGDIHCMFKYGFYYIYAIITVMYMIVLYIFPPTWRQTAAAVMILSDPAAMGLFFMGAMVLLEKSQRVVSALAVSPMSVSQYIWAKIISFAVISVAVALPRFFAHSPSK